MAAQFLKHHDKMLIFPRIFKHYLRSKTVRFMCQSRLFLCVSLLSVSRDQILKYFLFCVFVKFGIEFF
jgi:hypothetical protein